MSNVVDDRVVKMQFDNSNFEKNVSTSMSTLDKLKKSLDFSKSEKSLQGLQEASNKFSMDKIGASLEAIQNRFSTMGIVGMTIIQNLTNSALSALGNIAHRISNMVISGGISRAMNIENAKFQLEGLGIEYKDVFDAIDYAVTNTAYGLDAAAQAASQLSAAGLDYKNVIMTHKEDNKELTQMSMALRAVSGVAAQTQSDYSMVARYFQDVANAGKVTGATLTYMTQVLNLPVSQNLAEGLQGIADGSLEASESVQKAVKSITKGAEVSIEDVQKWASKGLITFDMFSTVMFDKYADHAVAANRTLSGVMSNIRAAFSKIGAEFVSPLIEIDGIVVQMFESIRRRLNEIKPSIIPFAKAVTDAIKTMAKSVKETVDNADLSWMKPFFSGLGKIIQGLINYLKPMKAAFETLFPKDTTNRMKSFSESLKSFGDNFLRRSESLDNLQKMYERFKGLFSILSIGKTILNAFLSPFKGFIQGLKESSNFSGSFIDSFADWAKNLDKTLKESEKLKEISSRLFESGKAIAKSLSTLVSGIVSAFKSIKEGPTAFISNIFDGFITDLGHTIIRIAEILTGKDLTNVVNIYDKIVMFVKNATNILVDVISSGIDKLREFFIKVKEVFSGIKLDDSVFSNFVDNIDVDVSPLEKVLKFISSIIDSFLESIKNALPFIKTVGTTLVTLIKEIFSGIAKALGGEDLSLIFKDTTFAVLLYNLKNVFVQINKLVGKANPLKALNNFAAQLKDTAFAIEKSFNAKYWLAIAGSILMIAFAMNMLSNIDGDKLLATTGVVLVLLESMNRIATTLTVSTKVDPTRLMPGLSGLIAMAFAIRILASAMKSVSDTIDADNPEKILQSFLVIEGLLFSLTIIAKILSTNSVDGARVMSGISGLIAMSLSIKILASAAKDFASMNWDELGRAGAAIGALMIALTAFAKIMQSTEISNGFGKGGMTKQIQGMTQLGLGLVLLGASMKIFASAAKDFASMNWDELGRAGAAIGALMIALTAFAKIMESKEISIFKGEHSKTSSANMIQLGIGLVLLGESMRLFADAAKEFASMDWGELAKAGAAIGTIIAGVAILSKATSSSFTGFFNQTNNLTKQNTTQNLITLGVGLVAIAASMKIFASAAEDFADLNWGELLKAGVAIGTLMVSLSLFSKYTSGSNMASLSGSLMLFSMALLMLVPALMAFGSLSFGGMLVSLMEIVGILAILGGASKILEPFIGSMRALSVTLLIFGGALAVVGIGLVSLSAGVSAAAGSIALILKLIKDIIIQVIETIHEMVPLIVETAVDIIDQFFLSLREHIPSIVESIIDILVKVLNIVASRTSELVQPIFQIVDAIADAFRTQFGEIDAESFLNAMIGLSAFLVILAATATIAKKSLIGVGAIMAVLAEVTAMFLLLSGINADTTLAIAQGLSETLIALSITVGILTLVGAGAAAALAGIASMGIVIAGIIAILAVLGGLKQIPGFEWLMSEGITILNQIGLAIGEFVGSIVSGIGIGLTSGLPEIADNLSEFITRLSPFIAGLKMIDSQMLNSALTLTEIILALTAADIIESLTSWFTGGLDITKFGEQLAKFGPYIMQFADSVRGINGDDVESAANSAKALSEMASNLPNEGGVVGWFMGENDMEEFGKKLVPFGKAMVEYANSVEGLDANVVQNSASAGKAIAELASSLPNTGGVAGWFMGENDMDEFAKQLVPFGKGMMKYAKEVEGLDAGVVQNSATAGKAMVELANTIPNTGGVVSWFTGDNDIDEFGEQLVRFGRSMSRYSKTIADIDPSLITNSSKALTTLVNLSNQLPNTGGAFSWFTGDNDIEEFGEQLVEFGSSIVEYSNSISGVNFESITGLTDSVKQLIELANYVSSANTDSLVSFAKNSKTFAEKFADAGTKYVETFLAQFRGSAEQVNTEIIAFVQNIVTAIQGRYSAFYQEGYKCISEFAKGMKTGSSETKKSAESITSTAVTTLNAARGKFYTIGVNIVNGLTSGLKDKDACDALAARLKQLASLMEDTTRKEVDSHSPSRVFERIGKDLVLGLALGVSNNSSLAEEASKNVADETIDAMSSVISRINDYLLDDIDSNPTITPVLDMSNVESNASRINELFNKSIGVPTIKVAAIQRSGVNETDLQNEQSNQQRFGTTFIQNNYSPKALSRTEIYRQTKNQFSAYREAFQ